MNLILELPKKIESRLALRAKRWGMTLPEFAMEVMVRLADESPQAAVDSIDEIMAPFRKQVAESGMNEDELDAFFQEIRQEVWDEEHGKVA